MTARHQLRIGNRRLGRDRAPIDASAAPPVGETLQLARERKGVDLYRAERDTKIRLRYLAALEDGDWNELPAPVYVKGFLRNYAIYLGLEPDDILERWRDEMEQMRTATRVAVAPPPMPLVEPGGRRFTISPAMIVAAFVALVVVAFVAYIGIQLFRFAETTEVALTNPANVFSTVNAEQISLEGTAGKGALITINGPGGQLYNTTANEDGEWTREVPLARGRNDFTIVATDAVTQRESDPIHLTITVPLPSTSPGVTPGVGASPTVAPTPVPITMNLFGPASGLVTTDPNVTVSGTTTGTRITIGTTYIGPPTEAVPTAAPSESPSPAPSLAPSPSATAPATGPSVDVTVTTGSFSEVLVVPVGRWRITVTSFASGLAPIAQDIEITVQDPPPTTLEMVLQVVGRRSWLRVVADGVRVPGFGGITVLEGETHTFTAQNEFCVRSGNAGAIHVALNGEALGLLGTSGEVGSWIIRLGQDPQPAPAPC